MGRPSRDKGSRGEREVVAIMRDHGWAMAARSHDGTFQRGRGDIRSCPPGTSWEVKRCETTEVWKWWRQAVADAGELTPIVTFRRSSSPWLALIELDELLPLLRLRESA